MTDMTIAEVKTALKKLSDETGSVDSAPNVFIYADRICGGMYSGGAGSKYLYATGATYAEVINALHAAWTNYRDQHVTGKVRAMAVKIMTITADTGSCTAAALRMGHDFTDADIQNYGDRACEEATRIAGSGPFSIIPTASNQVAAE